jgi:hypothetical protein
MSSLYIFATQSGNIPLSELDDNFAEVSQRVNTANYVVAGNQSNITNVGTLNSLSVFGNVSTTRNISAGNVRTTGLISAAGNVTGNYLFGDGGYLSNVTVSSNVAVTQIANGVSVISVNGSGGNATVQIAGTANVAVFQSTGVSVAGNVDAGNLRTTGTVSLAGNVDAGNLRTTGTVSLAGNVIAGGVVSVGGNVIAAAINLYDGLYAVTASVSGNATVGNIITNGQVTATGNVRGANIITNGTVSATGNINGDVNINLPYGFITVPGGTIGNNIRTNGLISVVGTATLGNVNTGGAISATGNITAGASSFFIGNGSQLTGITGSYGNSNVTILLSNLGSDTVSTTGNVSCGYIFGNGSQLTGIATSSYGNANVVANLAALSSNPVSTTGNVTAGNFVGAGAGTPTITSSTNLDLSVVGAVRVSGSVSATGNVTASYFGGNGSLLTNITGANVTGTVANATYATTAGSATTANTAITVTGNAQANITSVGTLTSLSVTGNVSAGGVLTDNYRYANGTPISFAGTYGNANVVNLVASFGSNAISTTGNVTAGYFVGNGSTLTGVATSVNGNTGAVQVQGLYDTRTSLYVVPSTIVHNPLTLGDLQSGYVGDGWTSTGFDLIGMTVTNFTSVASSGPGVYWTVSFTLEFSQAFFDTYVPGYTPDSLRTAQVSLDGPGQEGNYWVGQPNVATWNTWPPGGTIQTAGTSSGQRYLFGPAPSTVTGKAAFAFTTEQLSFPIVGGNIRSSPAAWPSYLYLKIWVSD